MNKGSVSTERLSDASQVDVGADQQTIITMSQRKALTALRQPEPVNYWNCGMLSCPEAVHGRWLKSNEENDVRLRAMPLLIGENKTIHATNFSVRSSGSPPVMIEKGSRFSILLGSLASTLKNWKATCLAKQARHGKLIFRSVTSRHSTNH